MHLAFVIHTWSGDRPRDPRHVYANPLQPGICPIVALGLYWAATNSDESDLLFPGNNQYDRFRRCWIRLLDQDDVMPIVDGSSFACWLAAGDMHVGRTVAGLPTESYRFSALAPHFETRDDCVKNGVRLMFPGLPNRLQFIAEYSPHL
ncbi:uncharacterized protein PITG_22162 [Phytophthora infestans T30-4]|uniref:Uncharacterized protein n=1 Tax=Phytophthora infestans (strain T30-4) TaxID=403677 RepID=D0RLX9_PHYIT|nr:uncharacterized protein PITG_22162 [Phytophthora infestans T30-4]EEY55124.1 conserved hypothetical protein [Phytophthora infestans T30-4]|eukprot:XP_002909951.1 conserved hypothetical protein [Phytophthora infestans T30-4]